MPCALKVFVLNHSRQRASFATNKQFLRNLLKETIYEVLNYLVIFRGVFEGYFRWTRYPFIVQTFGGPHRTLQPRRGG